MSEGYYPVGSGGIYCRFPQCGCIAYCLSQCKNDAMKNSTHKASGASLPSSNVEPGYVTIPENFAEHADSWLSREQIKQEIRELDALRLGYASVGLDDIVYHRINELLDMLDTEQE